MLELRNISKAFYAKRGRSVIHALRDVSLTIGEGETLGIMGPSGCGKSTLARVLLRLIPADRGDILYNGVNITKLSGRKLYLFRRETQFISQRPESFFDPSMKLAESLLEPLKIFGIYHKKQSEQALDGLLSQAQLNPALLARYPHQLSGGEIQRLSICRALLLDPKCLILDEATSMLDISVQAQILHVLKDLQSFYGLSYVFISHDENVMRWMTDRIMIMREGQILNRFEKALNG